ncbi:hypothetical protein LCL95_00260 [Bacillus timonensis]|nr:hypothetical protein [Bacillus timonensis]
MWSIFGIVLVGFVILLLEWRNVKKIKEKVVFLSILSIAVGLSIIHSMGMKILNPLELIRFVFDPIGKTIFSFLN